MQSVRQDLSYALRIARLNPGSTFASFLALALGIGASSTIFSVVNAVLIRPLPVKDADRVVRLFESEDRLPQDSVSMADYLDWRRRLTGFDALGLYWPSVASLTGTRNPVQVRTFKCEASVLSLLGVKPVRGRSFTEADDSPGHGQTAMLSWAFWQSYFGGEDVIGKKILVDYKPHSIVGVLPKGFDVLGERDVWVPVTFDLNDPANARGSHSYMALGRLRPGVSLGQANTELRSVAQALAAEYPKQNSAVGAIAVKLRDVISGPVRKPLLLVFGAVCAVLLCACGNVANLLLARASQRQREISVRIAIGASRLRLFRQLLLEALLLSGCSSAAGLALAVVAMRIVRHWNGAHLPRPEEITLDWRVLVFTIYAAIVTGVIFGLAPALRASTSNVSDALKQFSGRVTEARGQRRTRKLLVCAEAAIATLLLVETLLLVQSFNKVSSLDPGFQVDHLMTLYLSFSAPAYREAPAAAHVMEGVIQKVRALPGVRNAALTGNLPLATGLTGGPVLVRGKPASKNIWDSPFVQLTPVTSGYFPTMKIPVLKGRGFEQRDDNSSSSVVVVNRALAERFFPGINPIGHQISYYLDPPLWREIIGVVANVPQKGLEQAVLPEVFVPAAQLRQPWLALVARTGGNPAGYTRAIEAQVRSVDPDMPAFLPRTMEEVISGQLGWRAFHTSILSAFAALALILACIGIYAVIAHSVAQRTSEIGLRMAVGARSGDIFKLVLRQGAAPAILGAVIGTIGAVAVARQFAGILFEVGPTDLRAYAGALATIVLIAFAASYLPARRAARLDPWKALRYE